MFATSTAANNEGSVATPPVTTSATAPHAPARPSAAIARSDFRNGVPNAGSRTRTPRSRASRSRSVPTADLVNETPLPP